MSKKTVKHEVDLASLPPLSEKQKAELAALTGQGLSITHQCDFAAGNAVFDQISGTNTGLS